MAEQCLVRAMPRTYSWFCWHLAEHFSGSTKKGGLKKHPVSVEFYSASILREAFYVSKAFGGVFLISQTYILKVDNLAESVFLPQKIGGKSA